MARRDIEEATFTKMRNRDLEGGKCRRLCAARFHQVQAWLYAQRPRLIEGVQRGKTWKNEAGRGRTRRRSRSSRWDGANTHLLDASPSPLDWQLSTLVLIGWEEKRQRRAFPRNALGYLEASKAVRNLDKSCSFNNLTSGIHLNLPLMS